MKTVYIFTLFSRFQCDASGACTVPLLPPDVRDIGLSIPGGSPDPVQDTRQTLPTLPASGVIMLVVMLYDDQFLNALHSGSTCDAETTINGIMAHVQTFFNLASLGTMIKLIVEEIDHVSGTYVAGNNLKYVPISLRHFLKRFYF